MFEYALFRECSGWALSGIPAMFEYAFPHSVLACPILIIIDIEIL